MNEWLPISFWLRLVGIVLVGFKTTGMGEGTAKDSGAAAGLRGKGSWGRKWTSWGLEKSQGT